MTDFLTIALRNARRGYRVHPLRGKDAFLKDWPNVATTDEAQIRAWAEQFPNYNCGVAGGPDIAIVDSDRVSRLKELAGEHAAQWFNTYSVTSGRPDRAHFYYRMTDEAREFGNKKWAEPGIGGNVFEAKVQGGQVVAEGSIHPDTGQVYRVTQDLPLIPFPAGLMALMRERCGKDNGSRERVPREKIGEGGRHDALVREAGRVLRVTEMSKHVLHAHLIDFNEQWLEPPLDSEEVERVATSCNWKPEPEVGEITLGGSSQPKEPEAPKDWRTHYHTREETENAPKPEFLIDNFLQYQSISAIAGFVAHKKSFIALNTALALCSGEPLFGKFKVLRQPKRVLYLCPEMGLIGFSDRVKKIGLLPYVGDTFFFATLSLKDGVVMLPELTLEEVAGAVIFVDTATRFVEGNENSAEDMKVLARSAFALLRDGAESVVFLCHSSKTMVSSGELTLENAMRGSGELSAFLFSCWATRMQDPENCETTANLLKLVKARDFVTGSFEVTMSSEDFRMTYVDGSQGAVVAGKAKKADVDGKEEEALQFIRDNPRLSARKMSAKLKELGIKRSPTWVGNKMHDLGLGGVKTG